MPVAPITPDQRVAELAASQWGVVTAADLLACGLSRGGIVTRVHNGHLHRVYQGVYAVGHRHLSTEGRWLAAVRACGPGAVLSHYAAAALWGLVPWDGRPVDVTIAGTAPRGHARVRVHRTTRPEHARRRNVPVTPPVRTLDDLAPMLAFIPLRRAVTEAYNHRLVTTAQLARARSLAIRGIVANLAPTRSVLEDVVLDLILEAGFERPDVNVSLASDGGPLRPDFRWPHRRLIIEADGAATHDHDLARYDDARRAERLPDHRIARVTWREAVLRPRATVRRLEALRAGQDAEATARGRLSLLAG